MPSPSRKARVNPSSRPATWSTATDEPRDFALADQATSRPGTRKHSCGLSGRAGAGPSARSSACVRPMRHRAVADRAGGGGSTILRAVSGDPQRIALSEVIGGLSYALDVTEGERPGHAVRSCLIGMRLAQELGLDAQARSDLFYALLLKD